MTASRSPDRRSSRPAASSRASPACRRCAASSFACGAAKSTRCSARTAPASRRWSRSSTACIPPAPTPATITLDGQPARASPRRPRRAAAGVAYVPQEIEVLEQLSVAENVFAGHTGLGAGRHRPPPRARGAHPRASSTSSASTSIPRALVASLTSAQRHLVMIARALALEPRVLMLDEPTASLSGTEVERLFGVLRRLQGAGRDDDLHHPPPARGAGGLRPRHGAARRPRRRRDRARADFDEEQLHLRHVGPAAAAALSRRTPRRPSRARCSRSRTSPSPASPAPSRRAATSASPSRAGEIVGLAGLLGSGRSEILHGIYGRVPVRGRGAGRRPAGRDPLAGATRARAGIALLTEDRKRDGLLFNLPVGANITIGNLGAAVAQRHGQRRARAQRHARRRCAQLNVKASSPQASVAHLSGGNQQKLLFARVLMRAPQRAAARRADQGRRCRRRGTRSTGWSSSSPSKGVALVVVASELEEVIGLCDRCLVIADGRIVDEFRRGEGGEERVLRSVAAAQAARQARSDRERLMTTVRGHADLRHRRRDRHRPRHRRVPPREGAAVFGVGLDGDAGRDLACAATAPSLHVPRSRPHRRGGGARGGRGRAWRASAGSTRVVNCAGIYPTGKRLEEVSRRRVGSHDRGQPHRHLPGLPRRPCRCIRAAGGGAVVNIASVHADATVPGVPAYAATKAAVVGLSRQMALDYAVDRIRVNAVLVGSVATRMTLDGLDAAGGAEAARAELRDEPRSPASPIRARSPRRSASCSRTPPPSSPAAPCRSTAACSRACSESLKSG